MQREERAQYRQEFTIISYIVLEKKVQILFCNKNLQILFDFDKVFIFFDIFCLFSLPSFEVIQSFPYALDLAKYLSSVYYHINTVVLTYISTYIPPQAFFCGGETGSGLLVPKICCPSDALMSTKYLGKRSVFKFSYIFMVITISKARKI